LISTGRYRLLSLRRINNKTMTKKTAIILFLLFTCIVALACVIGYAYSSSPTEDQTQSVDRNGSIETGVSVVHADSTHDVILTNHKVWLHDSVYATIRYRDTIPALDSVHKDYQIFITLK
jgi:hypothetical protein